MNSLNVLSGLGTSSPPRSRSGSQSGEATNEKASAVAESDSGSVEREELARSSEGGKDTTMQGENGMTEATTVNEKTPLLDGKKAEEVGKRTKSWIRLLPQNITDVIISSCKAIFSVVSAPALFVASCFYDTQGRFSTTAPFRKLIVAVRGQKSARNPQSVASTSTSSNGVAIDKGDLREARRRKTGLDPKPGPGSQRNTKRSASVASNASTALTTDSEVEPSLPAIRDGDGHPRHLRSASRTSATTSGEEIAPARRSIRIKLYNEDALKQRRARRQSAANNGDALISAAKTSNDPTATAAAALKSPTSPVSALKVTRYPRAPAPPRPLVPKRQPSYAVANPTGSRLPQKTLIIDLDETLIHSYAKGGRMSQGHMVEVRLSGTMGVGGQVIGPAVPILYYVHKRPYCDEFLRKVSKWYNLVVFTASVQEYADPVIDWLELERKYFTARYYRQHCTLRGGAYIKDLSQVEPDLSRVMILDNSPMSYAFHEDNAIPIQGWISDPTDNDLLHLIPLLEGLQYVTDVRALLALRLGETPAPA